MVGLSNHTGDRTAGIQTLFPKEDTDFTPWLEKNIRRLAQPLGMKLRPIDRETWVPFGQTGKRIDILAEEPNLDSPVVVESQFGRSDDNHLGRLVIYAGTTEAGIAIWIAESFVREHLEALKWVNNNSSEAIQFYGVRIGTKLGSSGQRVPSFEVVLHPLHWSKSDKRLLSVDPEDWRDRYEAFWQSLVRDLRIEPAFQKARNPTRDKFYSTGSGFGGMKYVARFTPQSTSASVELAMPNRPLPHQSVFWWLQDYEDEISNQLVSSPTWKLQTYRSFSRLQVSRHGSIRSRPEELVSIREWMITNLLCLREVLTPYLEEIA